jgi:hypothetical protein
MTTQTDVVELVTKYLDGTLQGEERQESNGISRRVIRARDPSSKYEGRPR